MKNNFLKHFTIIGSGTLISMILGVLTTPLITRIVDPVEYGKFSIFTMYSNIVVMILYLGLDQSLVRYFYEADTKEYRRALLFKCVQIPIVATIIVSVIVILFNDFKLFEFEFGKSMLYLLFIYTFIQIIYRFSLLLVRLQYKSKLYSLLNIIQKVSYIVLVLPLLTFGTMEKMKSLIIATMIATLICVIISLYYERETWNFVNVNSSDCSISRKSLLKYAYPYIISMGVTTIFQTIDKISLNKYATYTEVGIFSSTMTLIHVFNIIQSTFNTLWAPMAIEHYTKDNNDKSYYQKGNKIITVIMFFIGISLILIKDTFAVLLGERYRQAAYILPFLIFSPIMYTISETTVSGLVFLKKSKMQVVVAVGACITNIIGNTILVPRLGAQGAAISTGVSYIVFFTLRTALSNYYFYIDFNLKKFYMLTGVVVLYAFYNTFIKFNFISVIGYFICLGIMIVLYWDTIKWMIQYLIINIKKVINKK